MDYGKLLERTWNVVWNNKFLIILGIVVALGSGGFNGGGGGGGGGGQQAPGPGYPQGGEYQGDPNFPENPDELREWVEQETGMQIEALRAILGIIVILVIFVILVGLTIWVIVTLARGGLIAGVNEIEIAGSSGFGSAVSAAWGRGWQLIGIGLIPAIPNLILILIGLGMGISYFGSAANFRDAFVDLFTTSAGYSMLFGMGALCCMGVPIVIALGILRTFAERACMIEETGVFDAYGRGWEILRGHFAEVVLLFLIQVGIGIAFWLLMFVPSIAMVLCCIFWPVLLVIQGTVKTYFSTMWTLAWREWAGSEGLTVEEAPAA
jgi:hypothetical protein